MPSYAILGATGATGHSILEHLKTSPENRINVYVRSKPKLEGMFPGITSEPNVHIFEGGMKDASLISRCVAGVSAVFSVIATNENVPKTSLAEDTARILVAALRKIREEDAQARLPRVVVLSSCTVNEHLSRHTSRLGHWIVHCAFRHIYDDLERAEAYYRQNEDWLNAVFIQPGGLVEAEQTGHELSTDICGGGFLSYGDLAAGMIEVADAGEKYDWKGVAVVPKGKGADFQFGVVRNFIHGLSLYCFPWLYGWI